MVTFSCFLLGNESTLIACADVLLERGHRIGGVLSSNPAIKSWAHEHGIILTSTMQEIAPALRGERLDYLFSITNLSIIPNDVLALAQRDAINFHDGPLPRYGGLNAPAWALIRGEHQHGVTWHRMHGKADRGEILRQEIFDVASDDTALILNVRCMEAAVRTFRMLLDDLESNDVHPLPHTLDKSSYCGKYLRPRAACLIAWNRSANEIADLVRGLDFGQYANPLGLPKVCVKGVTALVREVTVLDDPSSQLPGTVTSIDSEVIRVATGTRELALRRMSTIDGGDLALQDFVRQCDLRVGERFEELSAEDVETLSQLYAGSAKHEEFWIRRLTDLESVELPGAGQRTLSGNGASFAASKATVPAEVVDRLTRCSSPLQPAELLASAFGAFAGRIGGRTTFTLGLSLPDLEDFTAGPGEGFFSNSVPVRFQITERMTFEEMAQGFADELTQVRKAQTFALDVVARYPELKPLRGRLDEILPVVIALGYHDQHGLLGKPLTVEISLDASTCTWTYDQRVFDDVTISQLQEQFDVFLRALTSDAATPISLLPILSDADRRRVLVEWNQTYREYRHDVCVHQLFEEQVRKTPDAPALAFEHTELSYARLNRRANRLANYLHDLGVGPDALVGICVERSIEMAVSVLAVLKAGGAYVPIDPEYPADRIALMLEDSGASVLLTQERLADRLPAHGAKEILVDQAGSWKGAEESTVRSGVGPSNLAYTIYTSGSTGKPKGVMVEHRNVVNFFAAMDDLIDHDPPGVWLAVTSLSFDISVLELLWTLTTGFKVVLHREEDQPREVVSVRAVPEHKKMEFSLFYFASDEGGAEGPSKYRLLLEGAKFADQNGLTAIWTPERHFHAFGGLYPNPSVTSAAIAAVTENVKIRAGSCVLPLHNPIRVVEEWSLVDNLSNGRVGISFASGWQPNDFVLSPENYANAKKVMIDNIDVVRKLWRGEAVAFSGPKGSVDVTTLPRPVQEELPVWITSAGNPETFRMAGEAGAYVLTHLLGQTIHEVAEKLEVYRSAWRQAGHSGDGHVTLMLHTFLADDEDFVRSQVHGPLKEYLRTSASLIKQYASSFPAFKNLGSDGAKSLDEEFKRLTDQEMDELLEFSVARYYEGSGLFGTPSDCIDTVDRLKEIGVDEIACLIDFGIDTDTVLNHLSYIAKLQRLCSGEPDHQEPQDYSVPTLIHHHRVTHLQCTPSFARMLMLDSQGGEALGSLEVMLVGGETFPPDLEADLTSLNIQRVWNMYGPTETTVWSSAYPVDGAKNPVPIGRPVANTQIYVVDDAGQPVPPGAAGEIYIGGAGVTRGYLNQPDLTRERFVQDPFSGDPDSRLYRTGDLARYRPDGNLEFLGRMDSQVKIRGHRIELGEIEAVLSGHPTVREAVVVASRGEQDDIRLVAYIVYHPSEELTVSEVRRFLRKRLPGFMVPGLFVELAAMPRTPNGKTDRNALPDPFTSSTPDREYIPPATPAEQLIAQIWAGLLNGGPVGRHDNFFELGGHSLLAMRTVQAIEHATGYRVDPPSMFFKTLDQIAAQLPELAMTESSKSAAT